MSLSHVKIIYWRFHIRPSLTFWDILTEDMWNTCLQTWRKDRLKITLQENNSVILKDWKCKFLKV